MNNNTPETRDQKQQRLSAAFPTWCQAVAQSLGGAKVTPDECDSWRDTRATFTLPTGEVFKAGIVAHDEKIHIYGNWPKDHKGQYLSPSHNLRQELGKDSSINVGWERSPFAAAADIGRRFIPTFRLQWAGLQEVIAARLETANKIDANSKRIATILGCPAKPTNYRDESYERTLWPGSSISSIHTVAVRDDSVKFEITLPVAEAEQVLELVKKLQAARKP